MNGCTSWHLQVINFCTLPKQFTLPKHFLLLFFLLVLRSAYSCFLCSGCTGSRGTTNNVANHCTTTNSRCGSPCVIWILYIVLSYMKYFFVVFLFLVELFLGFLWFCNTHVLAIKFVNLGDAKTPPKVTMAKRKLVMTGNWEMIPCWTSPFLARHVCS